MTWIGLLQGIGHFLVASHFHLLIWTLVILSFYSYLQGHNLLPSISGFQAFVSSFNSRGGNILVLSFFIGWILVEVHWGMMPLDFWTGTAFGAFAGALLKTMTGGDSTVRGGDITANGGTVTATSKTTTATEVTKTDPAPVTPQLLQLLQLPQPGGKWTSDWNARPSTPSVR